MILVFSKQKLVTTWVTFTGMIFSKREMLRIPNAFLRLELMWLKLSPVPQVHTILNCSRGLHEGTSLSTDVLKSHKARSGTVL